MHCDVRYYPANFGIKIQLMCGKKDKLYYRVK